MPHVDPALWVSPSLCNTRIKGHLYHAFSYSHVETHRCLHLRPSFAKLMQNELIENGEADPCQRQGGSRSPQLVRCERRTMTRMELALQ